MRHRGLRGRPPGARHRDGRPAAPGVPRLRLGRCRGGRRRESADRQAGRQAGQPGEGAGELDPGDAIEHGPTGIGHTRWATHGGPTDGNAHPHRSTDGRVAVIHNGIIENFAELRGELEAAGCRVRQRDRHRGRRAPAAVRAGRGAARGRRRGGHLLAEAMRRVCRRLRGRVHAARRPRGTRPGVVVGARRNSPLVVGRGDGENFLACDVAAFIEHTREAVELGQDQVVTITPDGVEITDFDGNAAVGKDVPRRLGRRRRREGRLRLLHAQGDRRAAPGRRRHPARPARRRRRSCVLDEMRLSDEDLRDVDKIVIVACGTAYHAGLVAKYAIEHWTRIPCEVELASEFRYRDPVLDRSHPGRGDLPVRRDHGHAHGGAARPRAEAPGCWRSATPTARRSRASPTPCSTPTPARRSRSPRPRPS